MGGGDFQCEEVGATSAIVGQECVAPYMAECVAPYMAECVAPYMAARGFPDFRIK